MWRWSRVQRHNLALEPGPAPQLGHFLFLIRPGGALFCFLIRLLPAKWRWSQVQRHIWQADCFFFFMSGGPGVVVSSGTLRTPKAVPHLKVGQKCQNRHETGRELTKININQSKLLEISMRVQP